MNRSRALLIGAVALTIAVVAVVVAVMQDDDPESAAPPRAREVRLVVDDGEVAPPMPDGFTRRLVETPWRIKTVDGDKLTIVVAGSECLHFDHAVATIGTKVVAVSVMSEEWVPGAKHGCNAAFGPRAYRLELPEPLNGRAVTGECDPSIDETDPVKELCRPLASVG